MILDTITHIRYMERGVEEHEDLSEVRCRPGSLITTRLAVSTNPYASPWTLVRFLLTSSHHIFILSTHPLSQLHQCVAVNGDRRTQSLAVVWWYFTISRTNRGWSLGCQWPLARPLCRIGSLSPETPTPLADVMDFMTDTDVRCEIRYLEPFLLLLW